jgi:methionyl-tRNA formyltransferase
VPALDALVSAGHEIVAVYTQPDRPAGRGRELTASAVKQRAGELGLTVEQPASLKPAEAASHLRELAPDAMVVVAYGLLLPPAVLAAPRLGCVNIHASLLPRWRGAAPIQRAILAGDRETGITIMQMDAGLDTGPILSARALPIAADETGGSLHDKLAALGADAVVATLDGLASGSIVARPQPATGATYAAKIDKSEAVIDWRQPAAQISALVRAFNPWPVAQTTLQGQTLRIWLAHAIDRDTGAAPAEIVRADGGELVVATGAGALGVTALQLPGRRVTSAADFLHAWRGATLVGQRLGR